jgi:hypothetical protein
MVGNLILFNSPASGIDNIHAVNVVSGKRYQVTSSKYGAYNPALSKDGKSLYYNDQTKDGLDVVKIPFDTITWKPFTLLPEPKTFFQHLVEQEGRPNIFDSIPQQTYDVKKYSKLKGMLNPYSWGLTLTNNYVQLLAGISSRDLLNTTSISAGYGYDINERTGYWQAGVSYQGWYPIIDVTATSGEREDTRYAFGNKAILEWDENTIAAGLRIPLIFTQSKYRQQLTLGNEAGLTAVSSFQNTIRNSEGQMIYQGDDRIVPANDTLSYIFKDQVNGNLLYNRFWLRYDHVLKTSYRDFLYRWGQTLDFEIYNTPYGGDFEGRLMAVNSVLYFPGLFKHHYLYGRVNYQESLQGIETNLYSFRNRIFKPRGYSYPNDEKFLTLSANYAFPLWYPDIALGPVFNIQRIKLNLFYDYGKGTGSNFFYHNDEPIVYYIPTDAVYNSFGVETTVDFNIMRFLPKFELGFRTTYVTENRYAAAGTVFEIIIGNIGF